MAEYLQSVVPTSGASSFPKILGENNDHIAKLPTTDHHDCAEEVFKHIRERAQAAYDKQVPLVIMVFAPVTPEQDIIFDFGGSKDFLTTDKIRKVVRETLGHKNFRVSLVTPSPFTGGWMCNPSLFSRTHGTADSLIRVISKSCGAALADSLVEYYTTRRSPLLSKEQKARAEYDNMMPVWPTLEQVGLLHGFHRKIHERLEHRLSPLGGNHQFNFDEDKDAWKTYVARRGMSLNDWKSRWHSLMGVDVGGRIAFLGPTFGGSRASQLFHVQYLVQVELETCYGDWGRSITGRTKKLFENFVVNANPDEETVKRVFDAVEFRSSSMTMAQILAKGLDLSCPGPGDGVKCRYWRDIPLDDNIYPKLQHAFSKIQESNLFEKVAMLPGETRHEFDEVRFLRASRWLAASVATEFASGTKQDIEDFVQKKIAPFVRLIRVTQCRLLQDDPVVSQIGLDWIASLPGLGPGSGMAANTATLEAQLQSSVRAQGPMTVAIPSNTPKTSGTYTSAVPSGPSHIFERGLVSQKNHIEPPTFNNLGHEIKWQTREAANSRLFKIPAENIVNEPAVKVVVTAPPEERIVKPVENIDQESGVKVVVAKPHSEPFVQPLVQRVNMSVIGKPTDEPGQQISGGHKPSLAPVDVKSLIIGSVNTAENLVSLANMTLTSLSTAQLATILSRHPELVDDIIATAIGKMNLGSDGNQIATATTQSVVESAPVTAATGANKENMNATLAGQLAREAGIHDPSVETSPAPAALAAPINPTPPQTPIAGGTIGNPAPVSATGPQARATQPPSAGEARLAGPDDFFENIKKHAKW